MTITKILSRTILATLSALLLAPVVLVIALSFSATSYFSFPPKNWGMRQYRSLFTSDLWGVTTARSAVLALVVAAIVVILAVSMLLALFRSRVPFQGAWIALATAPLLIPGVALAIAMYELYARLGLIDTYLGLAIAHVILALPIAVLVMLPAFAMRSVDMELVAMTLGASRARAWLGITIRLLAPAIGAAAVMSFLVSFDEAVLVSFVGGPSTTTLPKAILESIATGVDPTITAVASLLVLVTAVLLGSAEVLNRKQR